MLESILLEGVVPHSLYLIEKFTLEVVLFGLPKTKRQDEEQHFKNFFH
jgi:hypothetical protein